MLPTICIRYLLPTILYYALRAAYYSLRTTHRVPGAQPTILYYTILYYTILLTYVLLTAYQARNLVNRKLSSREAELQLRSGMSEMDRAVLKLQTFARAVFKFKKLVVQ
jgi:hypothetical protein